MAWYFFLLWSKPAIMKIITSLISLVLFCQTLHAQFESQIRLKMGASTLFPSPGGRGYAFKGVNGRSGSVVLGGEFSHPFKNKTGAWHVGFTFQDGNIQPAPNEKNLIPINIASTQPGFGFSFYGAPAKTAVYLGIEKFIKRDYTKPSKNYFSVVAGAGVAFTLNKLTDWGTMSAPEKYLTRDGGIVEGYKFDIAKPSFPVAPFVYGGLRYNITNKKGREVFIIEFLFNYGITSYYKQTIDYTLNGAPRRDVLKEKGMCFQLNLIVPLYGFRKRR